jgi:hypothetical protein
MTTKEVSFRGHNTPHSLRDSNKALSGHQLQGAEAAGASEEDMGISPEKFIAYSVVRTKATLQECNALNLGVEFFFFFSLTKFRRYPFLFPFPLAKP